MSRPPACGGRLRRVWPRARLRALLLAARNSAGDCGRARWRQARKARTPRWCGCSATSGAPLRVGRFVRHPSPVRVFGADLVALRVSVGSYREANTHEYMDLAGVAPGDFFELLGVPLGAEKSVGLIRSTSLQLQSTCLSRRPHLGSNPVTFWGAFTHRTSKPPSASFSVWYTQISVRPARLLRSPPPPFLLRTPRDLTRD